MPAVSAVATIGVLALLAFGLVRALRLETPWLQPVAILRAAVQLGLLSLVLTGVIASPLWVAVFLAAMAIAATVIVIRRGTLGWRRAPAVAGILAVAAAVPLSVVFALGTVPFEARYLLAIGGILVGGAMTVSSLLGRTLAAELRNGRDEIEGWLALGATPRTAARRLVRVAASTALVPATDQTRMTGIVTLPGAFVGAVFAGMAPLEAAVFQVIVLAGILVAGGIAAGGMGWLLGAPAQVAVPEA